MLLTLCVNRQAEKEPLEGAPGHGEDEGCEQGQEEIKDVCIQWSNGWRDFLFALACYMHARVSRCSDCKHRTGVLSSGM
jgi:hypothetical protein